MATMSDYVKNDDKANNDDWADLDQLGQEEQEVEDKAANQIEEEFEVPEKFKGKGLKDIVAAYTELEKVHGRQANEFGELRKMTDKILMDNISPKKIEVDEQPQREAVSFDDLVEDPNTAVSKLVSSELKPLNDKLDKMEKRERLNEFASKFPTYQSDLADEGFQQWVQSSKYRLGLFEQANNYDTDAGTDLWTEWANVKESKKQALESEREEREDSKDKALKRATSESSSTGARTRKVYKRVELINLRLTDPEKWEKLRDSGELQKLYRDKRVK